MSSPRWSLAVLCCLGIGCGGSPSKHPTRPSTQPKSAPTGAPTSEPVEQVDRAVCERQLKRAREQARFSAARAIPIFTKLTRTIRLLRQQGQRIKACERATDEQLRVAASALTNASKADRAALASLARVYQLYLETFSSDPVSYRFGFYRAQVLYKLGHKFELGAGVTAAQKILAERM